MKIKFTYLFANLEKFKTSAEIGTRLTEEYAKLGVKVISIDYEKLEVPLDLTDCLIEAEVDKPTAKECMLFLNAFIDYAPDEYESKYDKEVEEITLSQLKEVTDSDVIEMLKRLDDQQTVNGFGEVLKAKPLFEVPRFAFVPNHDLATCFEVFSKDGKWLIEPEHEQALFTFYNGTE